MDHKSAVIVVAAVAILCSLSLASATEIMASFSFPPYLPSGCFDNVDKGNMIVGVGDSMWKNRAICGKKLTVKCIDGASRCKSVNAVDVTVVEYCKGCDGTIVLSQEAFELISYKELGAVKVDYVLS